jgi:hypothetical protein
MPAPLTVEDLWPLVQKLPQDQQVRLAKLALLAAAQDGDDRGTYQAVPPRTEEFSSDDESLAWDAEGWEKVDAPR